MTAGLDIPAMPDYSSEIFAATKISDELYTIFHFNTMAKEAVIPNSRLNRYGSHILTEGIDTAQYSKKTTLPPHR
jgi:hypothetical protein